MYYYKRLRMASTEVTDAPFVELCPTTSTTILDEEIEDIMLQVDDDDLSFLLLDLESSPEKEESGILEEEDDDNENNDDITDDDDDLSISGLVPSLDTAAPPNASPAEVENLIAKKLSQLSLTDRQRIHNDVQGISSFTASSTSSSSSGNSNESSTTASSVAVHVETEDFLSQKLKEFQEELDRLENVPAYDLAVLTDAEYVKKEEFRLRFLRVERFDCSKAALRFVRHFQLKLGLFGSNLLTRDIHQDDLDQDTLRALYSGFSQFLPLRDRLGRLVHVQFVQPNF